MVRFVLSKLKPTSREAGRKRHTPRNYTCIITSNSASKIHRLQLSQRFLYSVCGFALIGVVSVLGGFAWLVHKAMTLSDFAQVRTQNRELRRENLALKSHYDLLNQRVGSIQDISRELAANAKLPQPGLESVTRTASGGPEVVNKLESETQILERELRRMKDTLDQTMLRSAGTPSGLPVRGYLTDGFGSRSNPFSGEGSEFHSGQDISVPHGTPVQATANGLVLHAAPRAGYGNVVVIDHGNGLTTRYGHLSKIDVEAGQRIRQGDIIGRAGNTGRSTGTHVHYEVREYDVPVDPLKFSGTSPNGR